MFLHSEKTVQSKSQSDKTSAANSSKQSNFAFYPADNRPQTKRTAQLQSLADKHSIKQQHPIQKKPNKTGLPDNLKAGIENLSGHSMDDVKVHYNSAKPTALQAHAYAQGTDIHLGPGQEKHLPHEAWHVVQQKQGRVKPTLQMKGGVNINDDKGLEKEADVMGVNASQLIISSPETVAQQNPKQVVAISPHSFQLSLSQNKVNQHSHLHNGPVTQGKFVAQLGKKNKKKGKRASKSDASAREGAREARYAAKSQGGTTTFNNNEKKLPKAPKGTKYIETDVGTGRTNRGKRRVVSLVEKGSGRTLKQYNTEDHYATFR
ncbi:eCIS core domain-containing protein [Xanthomarina gelatinilytica]|uniref:eCIS core domain-containing protein n=1 Tax=Xanthomarina gelatinilytica TaxID=1137281 RepID=UPI003AA908DE